jgi:hypothetical protein
MFSRLPMGWPKFFERTPAHNLQVAVYAYIILCMCYGSELKFEQVSLLFMAKHTLRLFRVGSYLPGGTHVQVWL